MIRIAIALTTCFVFTTSARAEVVLQKTPGGGIQPQVVTDASGNVHLLYYQGEARGGDLMYVRRAAGKNEFSAPIKVNSQPGSAVAAGTMRGGHLAIGKNGRIHVAWNGAMKAEPKNPLGGHPMLYTRLGDDGKSFEPQRNLMTQTAVLDGGGTLAADAQGNVTVAWHALGKGSAKGEGNRQVWVSISRDDGKTFAPERLAWDTPTGACPCCGMRGFTDRQGTSYFLYRAASAKINRGMYVLQSSDLSKPFVGQQLDNWKIETCPMSSEAFAEGPAGLYAAWDNDGQIFFSAIQPKITPRQAPGTSGNRKHPALAFNKNGDMLLAWTEGTGWMRGGALAWQVYDKAGNPTESGRRNGAVPVWGLPAVIAETDGRFTILH